MANGFIVVPCHRLLGGFTYRGINVIKRQYFIKTEITLITGVKHSFRQFYKTSWMACPESALKEKIKQIAEQSGVSIDDVFVSAFNRV